MSIESIFQSSSRFCTNILSSVTISRIAVKSFTLSDGTYVPKGTAVSCVAAVMHRDPEIYGPNADEFDGFRFSNQLESSPGEETKYQMVTTGTEFLPFGHGPHAWWVLFRAISSQDSDSRIFAVPDDSSLL